MMKLRFSLFSLLCFAAFSFTSHVIAQGNPPAALATFTSVEYLSRHWPRTLVSYPLALKPGQAMPERLRLLDTEGKEQPYQLTEVKKHADGSLASAQISFMAELPKNGRYQFQLFPEVPAVTANPVKVSTDGEFLTLDNGVVAIRLPKAGDVTFDKPLLFGSGDPDAMPKLYGKQAENGITPGPIQGIRLSDDRWVGGSYFYTENAQTGPKTLGYSCKVTEQGPLFTEAQIRYTFDADRFYQLTVRLLPNDPAARIDEQHDMKDSGHCQVAFSLSSGWQPGGWKPDYTFWENTGYGGPLQSQKTPIEEALKKLGFEQNSPKYGSSKLPYDKPLSILFPVEPWTFWGQVAHHFAVVDSSTMGDLSGANLTPKEKVPFLGVVPMHAGNWRGDGPWGMKLLATHGPSSDVTLHWSLNIAPRPNELTQTGEYDPAVPYSFGRRQWALFGGPLQGWSTLHNFRLHEGYVNLDDYKDWILDWPQDPKVTYPRLFITKADVDKFAANLANHPAGEFLSPMLMFKGDEKRRELRLYHMKGNYYGYGSFGTVNGILDGWSSDYRMASNDVEWAPREDELLADPKLSPEDRQTLRRTLAALASLYSEPDFNPRGSMVHLGNPNMPINRFMGLPIVATLIPDHPRYNEWMDISAEYVRYKLAQNSGPNGVWMETLSYYTAGAPWPQLATTLLRRSGRLDETTVRQATETALFPMYLMTPKDPRFGVRAIPNWGHEGSDFMGHWLFMAGALRDTNPEAARDLIWTWDQLGRPGENYKGGGIGEHSVIHSDLVKTLKPGYVPARLKSTWLPGFGASLRAHAGDPNETFLAYRAGYFYSHSDANQGDFIIHAKGAPLVTLSLFIYGVHAAPYGQLNGTHGWHSNVRMGSQTNMAGGVQPLMQVQSHSFSDSVDYLRSLADYPQQQRWTRQIAFMKGKSASGPNYFVFRDSAHNLENKPDQPQPKWWSLRTLGDKNQVAVSPTGFDYTSTFGSKLNVRFLQPPTIQASTKDATHEAQIYKHAANRWAANKMPIVSGSGEFLNVRETQSVTSVGPIAAGQDILTVLYPQTANEAAPKSESLADGVAKITTSEGVDYLFVGRAPFRYSGNGISFNGIAGAVRIYPTEVHLVISEGPGELTYQGVTLRSSKPVTRVLPRKDVTKKQLIAIPDDKPVITFALKPADGAIEEVQPGVKKQMLTNGFAYTFESTQPISFTKDDVTFTGKRGGLLVNTKDKSTRLVMLDGEKIGHGTAQTWESSGPYDVTIYPDRIAGHYAGQGRFLYLKQPAGIKTLPKLLTDGRPSAPGTFGDTIVMPMMPGEHRFEIRPLKQPSVWRDWQDW